MYASSRIFFESTQKKHIYMRVRERVRRRVIERGGEGDKERGMLANVTGMKVGA